MKLNRTRNGKRLTIFIFLIEKLMLMCGMHRNMQQIWQISFLHTIVNKYDMESEKKKVKNLRLVEVEHFKEDCQDQEGEPVAFNFPGTVKACQLRDGSVVTGRCREDSSDIELAEIFEVAEYHVVDAIENTAKEGATEALAFTATKKAALYYAPASAGLMVPSAGYNFTWNELDNASGYGIDIRSYSGDFLRVEGVAEMLEANMAYDQKVVGADLGVFFNTILS